MRIFRSRRRAQLRYHVYVSDAKLDMLYEQVPTPLRKRLAAEVKVDLKLISITVKEAENKEPVRLGRLAVVERFIDEQFEVGTISAPAAYFRGTMDMRQGTFQESIVLFYGRRGGDTVALGGSLWHLIGGKRPENEVQAYSAGPALWVALAELISADPEGAEWVRRERENPSGGSEESAAVHDPPEAVLGIVDWLELDGPIQRVEFLARRLVSDRFDARENRGSELPAGCVTLGTPRLSMLLLRTTDNAANKAPQLATRRRPGASGGPLGALASANRVSERRPLRPGRAIA
jgi:hypothetical protein